MFEQLRYMNGDSSLSFTDMESYLPLTRDELFNIQMTIEQVQIIQHHHAERLSKLEKRQTNDAAIKSVWSSPFPTGLTGTPQHGPVNLASHSMFDSLEENGEHLLASLHLSPSEEEPVRRGAASRANSVRFDESALQGSGWTGSNNNHRNSYDFAGVRLGGGLSMERSFSHKSDGRHSSAGQSVHSHHSVVSGRVSSSGLETTFPTGLPCRGREFSAADFAEPPPGLFVLGSVPSIIRCWLTTNFRSKTLLYAIVCSGAQKSTVESSLLRDLDLIADVRRDTDGTYRIRLPVYLAEAIPHLPVLSRPDSPTSVPHIMANLEVIGLDQVDNLEGVRDGIRIFLGSDTLRAYSADILFSLNQMAVYSCDRTKLTIPFVRPEDDDLYRHMITTNAAPGRPRLNANAPPFISGCEPTPIFHREGVLSSGIRLSAMATGASNTKSDAESDTEPVVEPDVEPDSKPDAGVETIWTCDAEAQQELSFPHQKAVIAFNEEDSSHSVPEENKSQVGSSEAVFDDMKQQLRPASLQVARSNSSLFFSVSSPVTEPSNPHGRRDSATGVWGSWRHEGSAGPGGTRTPRDNSPMIGYQPASRGRNMKVLRPHKWIGVTSAKIGGSQELDASSQYANANSIWNRPVGSTNRTASGESLRSQTSFMNEQSTSASSLPTSATYHSAARRELPKMTNGNSSIPAPPLAPVLLSEPKATGDNGWSANPIGVASAFSWMRSKSQTATAE